MGAGAPSTAAAPRGARNHHVESMEQRRARIRGRKGAAAVALTARAPALGLVGALGNDLPDRWRDGDNRPRRRASASKPCAGSSARESWRRRTRSGHPRH
eukprot:6191679-Pleurochrysis_carterae.AAC.2